MPKSVKTGLFWLLVVAICLYALFPFYYAIITSLRPPADIFTVNYFPGKPTTDNYVGIFKEQNFAVNIFNSLLVSGAVTLISLGLGVTAAYALGRIQFAGRGLLLTTILSVSMFPQVAVLSGMYELVRVMGLYNTPGAMIFSDLLFTLPFTVWVLTTFVKGLPKEIEEAAIVDGATPLIIIRRVFLPLLAPAMVTTGLLAFIGAWNEFLFALTFTIDSNERTVPVAIAFISGATKYDLPWGRIMAASVTVTLPLIVLVLIFQRKIVAGLTAGAVKG
ncbi:MAG: carbohydrate ABC transporter permease [Hyphomicrobiales bacterium]|nr:carbohydrate ABC transporter permease [Hyphomicrobiales bacterium]MDE2017293.1 carbohydrate ABC transporter permease [Hyphomicrobiales bacterium]